MNTVIEIHDRGGVYELLYLSEFPETFLDQFLWPIPTKYHNRAKNKRFLKNLIREAVGVLWKLGETIFPL